eukprot:352188-Chlamydomonas_euryale.AAC.1
MGCAPHCGHAHSMHGLRAMGMLALACMGCASHCGHAQIMHGLRNTSGMPRACGQRPNVQSIHSKHPGEAAEQCIQANHPKNGYK